MMKSDMDEERHEYMDNAQAVWLIVKEHLNETERHVKRVETGKYSLCRHKMCILHEDMQLYTYIKGADKIQRYLNSSNRYTL